MMNEDDARLALEKLFGLLRQNRLRFDRHDAQAMSAWMSMHDLAEIAYQPALAFFEEALHNSNALLRWTTVRNLGYHYTPADLKQFLPRFRQLLADEEDEDSRRTIAQVLGRISEWPDDALIRALKYDADLEVREQAFASLLRLMRVDKDLLAKVQTELSVSGQLPRDYPTFLRVASAAGRIDPDVEE